MNMDALIAFNRWWIGMLVDALLRPVFVKTGGSQGAIRSLRFLRLLDACDSYPFRVEISGGLWITDEPPMVDYYEEDMP